VAEVVEQGVTGFVVETAGQAADAVQLLSTIDRAAVRRRFEERFSLDRMVGDYFAVYRARLEEQQSYGTTRIGRSTRSAAERPIKRRLWARMEFDSGREYARERARIWGWEKRLLYLGGSPLIPLVRSVRILKQLIQSGIWRDLKFRDILQAPVGLIFSALGEMAGYLSKDANSANSGGGN
jgi:hypothetical protein